jgi:four helix bundle protein
MQGFRDLKVWQKAHHLTLAVYQITAKFPREEMFGLTRQTRRASSSIAANLAEGCARNGDAEFARFCFIAMGSASELEYHLLLARDLEFLSTERHADMQLQVAEVKKMLAALIRKLTADS